MKKIPVWTFADMSVNDVAQFANKNELQPGEFQVVQLQSPVDHHDTVRVFYLAVAF